MSERLNVGYLALGVTRGMEDASLAFKGAVALQVAERRLARANQELATACAAAKRADARLARLDLMDMLGL